MASQTPVAIQNENLHIQPDQGASGAKVNVPKSEQKGRKERKALADVSNAREPALSRTKMAPLLKNKSAIRSTGNLKTVPKNYGLSEDQIKRCYEWAREGIEHVHFSGNDLYQLHKDIAEKEVENEVDSVLSALKGWTQMTYGSGQPLKEGEETEDFSWPLHPEVFLPSPKSKPNSDDPFFDEFEELMPLGDYSFELMLKDDRERPSGTTL
ncbi:hypothetical protein H6P81_006791 [Aristolochia fimbriata]|uniref:Uncharacterized protein n=1 Tax=Aristolochia fimbriata TaxID=158543 RepID=A0AAV7F262_ARIFI|nr:hypothetical protein H6P81_006791 [Aristolochia fimbriata]